MRFSVISAVATAAAASMSCLPASAGQAPYAASAPDVPVSRRDRVYSAEQFSNTVSVTDPADNRLLGVIRLGEPSPRIQPAVSRSGARPRPGLLAGPSDARGRADRLQFGDVHRHRDQRGQARHLRRPVAARGVLYAGRQRSLGDGPRRELRLVLDAKTYEEKTRITVPNGPGMQIFSPDGKYGYVCSSFTPETEVITVADHQIVGAVPQPSPFCPNIAATPDGNQVWFTLKDTGKTQVFDAHPPFVC